MQLTLPPLLLTVYPASGHSSYIDSDDPENSAPRNPAASVDPAAAAHVTHRRPHHCRQRQDDKKDRLVIFHEARVNS